jgi:predicted RNA binding protein YcfA (HicA-like mRNA interferase family)
MMINPTSWKTKVISAFTLIVMLFTVFSAPVSALDLENLLKDKVISVLRAPAEKAVTYGNYVQKLLKINTFQDEAEKRTYYQNKELAVKNKIQLKTQNVYNKFDSLVTKNVDKVITPDTHWSLKFVGGLAEGIPKGILDLGVLGYNVYERGKAGNLYATSLNTYYKLKDNQAEYKEIGLNIANHPLQAGGAVAGVLYSEGKDYALTLYHNPRAAGNLAGSFVGIGGLLGAAGKSLKAVNKGLPAATRALESVSALRIPTMGATPVAVGTAAKASKIEYRCPTVTVPKLTVETKRAGKTNLAGKGDLADKAGKAGNAGKAAPTLTSSSGLGEFPSGRISGMEVVKFLAGEGFELLRIRGSHYIMKGPNGRVASVPVHGSKNVAPGTLTDIKKAAGYK